MKGVNHFQEIINKHYISRDQLKTIINKLRKEWFVDAKVVDLTYPTPNDGFDALEHELENLK